MYIYLYKYERKYIHIDQGNHRPLVFGKKLLKLPIRESS